MSSIAAQWQQKPFTGMASYTLTHKPELLLHVAHEVLRDCFFEYFAHVSANRRFLKAIDMACATGEWSRRWSEIAREVVGYDINPAFIAEARRLHAEMPAERLRFELGNMIDFDGYEGVDLACFGGCFNYLDDAELDTLLGRLRSQLAPGAMVYVRATVVHPWRRPHRGRIGYYRSRERYERDFAEHGFACLGSISSATLVGHEVARAALAVDRDTVGELLLRDGVDWLLHAPSFVKRANRFHNWVLAKP